MDELDRVGWAVLPGLLNSRECAEVVALYEDSERFRSKVVMARHGFGRGEYQYFRYPLPEIVQRLRESLYERVVAVARRWKRVDYPARHEEYRRECEAAGQLRPTPLLLRYGAGDYNCLHQDLYGEMVFPVQVAILLSKPDEDFAGGEFVLTEQRPRMQSRVSVVPLKQGDGVAFAVNERPVQGTRGIYKVKMRHGVSELRRGSRHTLGIIFHDAA
jgi:hypothetical protein